MKLLKLDARFEDARRVARCLVGSQTRGNATFLCVDISRCFVIAEIGYMGTLNVELPLNTLKFCPFVAMREKVIVKSDYTPCVLNPTTFEVSGLIKKMEFDCDEEHFSIIENGQIFDMCGFEEITLDLTPIERGELEGCEIVEVGE